MLPKEKGLEDKESGLAGRQGFEPRSSGPEPPVLPLNDLPTGPNPRKTTLELQVLSKEYCDSNSGKRNGHELPGAT